MSVIKTPCEARANTDHDAIEDYELSFRKGDIISIVDLEGEAATGILRGRKGVLHLRLVDIIQEDSSPAKIPRVPVSASSTPYKTQPLASSAKVDMQDDWDEEASEDDDEAAPAGQAPAAAAGTPATQRVVPRVPVTPQYAPPTQTFATPQPSYLTQVQQQQQQPPQITPRTAVELQDVELQIQQQQLKLKQLREKQVELQRRSGISVSQLEDVPLTPVEPRQGTVVYSSAASKLGSLSNLPAEMLLQMPDSTIESYGAQVASAEKLLARVSRNFYWMSIIESILIFFAWIVYFANTYVPMSHFVWVHLPHWFRVIVMWYIYVKVSSIQTFDRLKTTLDKTSQENALFFSHNLFLGAVLLFLLFTAVALIMDFANIWARVNPYAYCNAADFVQPGICSFTSVFWVLTFAFFLLTLYFVFWVPTLSWGMHSEMWARVKAQLVEHAPAWMKMCGPLAPRGGADQTPASATSGGAVPTVAGGSV
eukprot:TRINITY_DN12709_c0_g1_i1.p1 TRINITY_DN12709_c0_g1~~TRINITY_DN12709_c0_g1_i1.p1  ORF type:complete len:494 (-),score=107.29 TRINITY_DN12709_c0_g1_i1:1412-2854(-)